MNDFRDIKKLLLPLLKGSPIILLCLVGALFLAKRGVQYLVPQYESTAKLKLDDSNIGVGNNILYKDFDLFPTTDKIATEVEVLKSQVFLQKVIEKLGFAVSYHRVGSIKTAEMFEDSPFKIYHTSTNEKIFDRKFNIKFTHQDTLKLDYIFNNETEEYTANINDTITTSLGIFHIDVKEDSIGTENTKDKFYFTINSVEKLVSKLKNNLDIKELNKDIPIIRISYKDPIPQKTTLIVNTIAETYIEDYIDSKTQTAQKTTDFIEKRLGLIEKELKRAEKALEDYKLKNNVINLKQETEIGLKKISQLKVQLANLEMNEAALEELNKYINEGDSDYLQLAPQVGFGDLLFTEMVKKLKNFQIEKKELLLKYQPENEIIQALDINIEETINYLRLSIQNAKNDISTKRSSIQKSIVEAETIFDILPSKEKALVTLERQFQQKQKTFNFLTEKRTEAAIASAANLSFHRILQKAHLPKAPVSPNKTLIYFVSGLLGIIIGIILIFIYLFIHDRINNRDDIERKSTTAVLGTLPFIKKDENKILDSSSMLINKLNLNKELQKNQAILVSSAIKKEGKTHTAQNIAKALAKMGWKVGLVDFNLHNPQLHNQFGIDNLKGISEYLDDSIACSVPEITQSTSYHNLFIITAGLQTQAPAVLLGNRRLREQMQELKQAFDLLVIDTPATAIAFDGIHLMPFSEHNLYLVRAYVTPSKHLINADLIKEEYKIENLHIVLNGVKKGMNYEGYFSGNNLKYKQKKTVRTILPIPQHTLQKTTQTTQTTQTT